MIKLKSLKMNWVGILIAGLLGAVLSGCGGGGAGGSAASITITGKVLNVETGGATNPQASVQVGGNSVLTNITDGSFSLAVPSGTSSITIDTLSSSGVWTFKFPAATATEDVGNLWVGVNRVTLKGRVVDASTTNPVAGAAVSFAGVAGVTDASGNFSLSPVAYPTSSTAAFFGIVGQVTDISYFANSFSAQPNMAISGVVTVSDILLTPLSSTSPPGTPYNIWGRITPSGLAPGTTVVLLLNGTAIRQTSADSSGSYYFFAPPNSYTITYMNGTHSSPAQSVTVASQNDIHRIDVVLN